MKLHFPTITILSIAIAVFMVADAYSHQSLAQVRSSSNYQLQSDSINIGGGLSSSTNFTQESTVGEIGTGRSESATFSLQAGYQQMQEVFLSLGGGADVTMSPDLPGLTGGESNGSTTFTVITDSSAGYQLTIQAEDNPAMQRADGVSINDYSPTGAADYVFSVPAADAEFGFTPEGNDIVSTYQDNNAGVCGVGGFDNSLACWSGLAIVPTEIARGVGSNHPTGATTTINFRVGVNSGANIQEGLYVATTTVTAMPL